MTYRDPLYDSNSPAEGRIDDRLDNASGDSSSMDDAKAKAGEMKQQGQQAADQAREKGEELAAKGEDAMDQAKARADELGNTAHTKADEGIDKASEGLSTAATRLREQGEQQEGQVGQVAANAADKLESASGYLREHDSNQMVNDLEDLVRRRPMESLLVAAGIGLVLSRIIK